VAEALERDFGELRALDAISLTVQTGEIYGFLGPNGAGKTTLLRILTTLLRPTAGRAFVAGHDVVHEASAVRLATGVALQAVALDDKQTGRELLQLQARLYGLRRGEVQRRVGEVLALVDIAEAIDRRIATYSGGMKRRLDLAAALVHNPEVLFLDEPTTGLDPTSRVAVWEEVRRLRADLDMTIFLTTQYLQEADELADRVGIISSGRLVSEGTPNELKRRVADDVIEAQVSDIDQVALARLKTFAGIRSVSQCDGLLTVRCSHGARLVSPVALALSDAGLHVGSITLREPTLEDVFFEITAGSGDTGNNRSES
jgi:ABC-2 type transport system ATP-binding protein